VYSGRNEIIACFGILKSNIKYQKSKIQMDKVKKSKRIAVGYLTLFFCIFDF